MQVEGVVSDNRGVGFPGASVYIQGTFDGTSSDSEGGFRFTTQASLPCTLRVDYLGFKDEAIVLDGSSISMIHVILEEEFNQLKAVTITAGAFRAGDVEKAVVLKPLDIVTTAGATGDVVGAMQTLPGTTAVGESGRLFVRGGSAMETGTYVDGMLVHEPYTRSAPNTAVRGRFNPFIFCGTNFTTGGYSTQYGQALSSLLLMDTKDIEEEDEWNLSLMTVGADAAGTKTWTGGSLTASFSYNRPDTWRGRGPSTARNAIYKSLGHRCA